MFDLNEAIEKEKKLERKYQGVIGYVEAKQFLKETGYTAAKIRGALGRFTKESSMERPKTFVEMEEFTIEFVDWWLDENVEIHKYGERKLYDAVANYLAFTTVWKSKSKSLGIYTPELMKQVGMMIVVKNTLAQAVKIGYSYAKRNPELRADELKDGFLLGFSALLPTIHSMHTDKIEEKPNSDMSELTRLIGAYLSGKPDVVEMAKKIKRLE